MNAKDAWKGQGRFCPRLLSFTNLLPRPVPDPVPSLSGPLRPGTFVSPVPPARVFHCFSSLSAAAPQLTWEVVLQQQSWGSGISQPIGLPGPVFQHFYCCFFYDHS